MIRQNQDPMTLEYIWIANLEPWICSKTRVSDKAVHSLSQVPQWSFDGSYTGDSKSRTGISDVNLKPVAMFGDPFSNNSHSKLILCETYASDGEPPESNKRNSCADIMERAAKYKPWFGIEQEYFLTSRDILHPLGWLNRGYQLDYNYYCAANVFGRQIARQHLRFCDYAGIKIGGIKAGSSLGLWEYQVGPCEGVEIGDQLWMSRYILERVAEDHNASVELKVQTYGRDGEVCAFARTNFSTVHTRAEGSGLLAINEAIEKLSKRHGELVYRYHSTDPLLASREERIAADNPFTSGVGVRYVSVRIPDRVSKDGYGYFEDRRPPGDCDPYEVIKRLVETVCLDE